MPIRSLLHSSRINVFVLIIVLCIVNGYLLYSNGIKIVNDSARYLEYANGLRSGFYFDPHNFWYIGYSLFILTISSSGGGVAAIVISQIVLFFLATISLYFTAELIWNSKLSAFFTALLFLFFIDIPVWNTYILAESIFVSFTCFSFLVLALLVTRPRSPWLIGAALIIIPFAVFIKPTGIALLVACVTVLSWKAIKNIRSIPVRWTVVLIASSFVILMANRMLHTYLIMENYQLGEVIYGVTTIDSNHYPIDGLIVSPPGKLHIPDQDTPPLLKILSVAVRHPVYWTQLFFTKAFYLFFHVRPFWSTAHNVFSILILLPAYIFCVVAFFRGRPNRVVFLFAVTFLLVHTLAVCLTSEDWDGRFLIPMLPVVFLFAGNGVEIAWRRFVS